MKITCTHCSTRITGPVSSFPFVYCEECSKLDAEREMYVEQSRRGILKTQELLDALTSVNRRFAARANASGGIYGLMRK